MLKQPRGFWALFGTDLIVRTAYQMGKTPVLPLFAASIGAGQLLVGSIVAVSTVTGMVLKPVVGGLSDRWGRLPWLFAALALFAGTPFLYRLLESPEQLFWLRLFHGTATAILAPVTLALVIEMDAATGRARRLAWFEMARGSGYLLAPAIAGGLLTVMPPEQVFTVIGLASCAAFLPAALVRSGPRRAARASLLRQLAAGLGHAAARAQIWLAAALETTVYVVTYGLKAFLPLFVVQETGHGVLAAGLFFTVQEAAHLAARPLGGRLGDRTGYLAAIAAGMATIGLALLLLPAAPGAVALLAVATLSGIGQGLTFPSTVAMVGAAVAPAHLGLGLGVYGTLKNLGKVAGPVLAGGLLELLSYDMLFHVLAGLILAGAAAALLAHRRRAAAPAGLA